MLSDLSDAAPAQLLHAAENGVQVRRIHEVEQLELLLAWADLHSNDPQTEPDASLSRFLCKRSVPRGWFLAYR